MSKKKKDVEPIHEDDDVELVYEDDLKVDRNDPTLLAWIEIVKILKEIGVPPTRTIRLMKGKRPKHLKKDETS
jgi:hypothetical protein